MKKDIEIPKVEGVYMAIIPEENPYFDETSWYAYLVNETNQTLEMAIVVSSAYGQKDGQQVKTSIFRNVFKEVAPNTAIRVELISQEVIPLSNQFAVTYFLNDKLYEKTYIFNPNTINIKALSDIPLINKRGCVVK